MVASPRIWLLRAIPPIGYGRWISAFAILVLLLTFFWSAGLFEPAAPFSGNAITLFYCAIVAYIVPVFHFITERTEVAILNLSEHLNADAATIRSWQRSIAAKSWRWVWTSLAIGTGAWIAHYWILAGSLTMIVSHASSSLGNFAEILGAALVWTVMTVVIMALLHNAVLFRRLAMVVRVDLLNPSTLTPFARVSVASTLALIGAQAAFPLMWVGGDVDVMAFAPGLIATAVPMVFLFMLPILPLHRTLVAAKGSELERLNALIDTERANGEPVEDPGRLARLAQLLSYRREINNVAEWPFDTGIVTRLGLYLIIPPFTWVGAALIENAVDTLF